MEQPEIQPIHQDIPKSRFNITLMLAGVITFLGFLGLVQAGEVLLLVVGVAGLGFSWFTNARQYLIYENALVIIYGRPRVKVIQFPEISHLEMLVLPMGNRLRVRLVKGGRIMVGVRNIEEFRARLDEALEKFNGDYQQRQRSEEGPENLTPY